MKEKEEFTLLTRRVIAERLKRQSVSTPSTYSLSSRVLYRFLSTSLIELLKFIKFAAYIVSLASGKVKDGKIPNLIALSLSKDQLFRSESPDTLEKFFRENRFDNPKGKMIIESKSLGFSSLKNRSMVTSVPIHLYLFKLSKLGQDTTLANLRIAFEVYSEYISKEYVKDPKSFYVIFEAAFWFSIRQADITIITNQSCMHQLPIPFLIQGSSFQRKMLWYSTNSEPFEKNGVAITTPFFSQELDTNIDMHYVWDSKSMAFLNRNGIKRIRIVGSILFTEAKKVQLDLDGFTFVYFDVTPLENPNTYYTVERMCSNLVNLVKIVQVISAENQVQINLVVKPKRVYSKLHSKKYINLLSRLHENGDLIVLRPGINLYGLVSEVQGVLGIPFTSPVVVGKELNVPSVFVDLYRDEYQLPTTHNELEIIADSQELRAWLEDICGLKLIPN